MKEGYGSDRFETYPFQRRIGSLGGKNEDVQILTREILWSKRDDLFCQADIIWACSADFLNSLLLCNSLAPSASFSV